MSKKSFYKVNKLFDEPQRQSKPSLTRSGVPVVQRPSASPSPDLVVRTESGDPLIDDTTLHTAHGKKYTVKKVTNKVTTIEGGNDQVTTARQSRYMYDDPSGENGPEQPRSTIRSQYGSTSRKYQMSVGPDEFRNIQDDEYKKFYDPKSRNSRSRRDPRNDDDDKFNVFDDSDIPVPEYQSFKRSYIGGADQYIVGEEVWDPVRCSSHLEETTTRPPVQVQVRQRVLKTKLPRDERFGLPRQLPLGNHDEQNDIW